MVDSSREAFERWVKREGKGGLARLVCWQAWQASRSAADSRTEEYLRKLAWSEEDISAWKAWGK